MQQQLKQRLLGAAVIISLGVIFLPVIFDGDGYRQLTGVDLDIPEQPHISFDQSFPQLSGQSARIETRREQVNVQDLPASKLWFVYVDDRDSIDGASSLARRLTDDGYQASYRMVSVAGDRKFRVEVKAGEDRVQAGNIALRIKQDYQVSTSLTQR